MKPVTYLCFMVLASSVIQITMAGEDSIEPPSETDAPVEPPKDTDVPVVPPKGTDVPVVPPKDTDVPVVPPKDTDAPVVPVKDGNFTTSPPIVDETTAGATSVFQAGQLTLFSLVICLFYMIV